MPRPCIRWVAKTHTHDAIMRIGGEAPRRRAHSTPRHESHVGTRVAATSNRHRQTVTLLRDAPKLSGVKDKLEAGAQVNSRRTHDDALRNGAFMHQPP